MDPPPTARSGILTALTDLTFALRITPPAAMRRITGKAKDETLIELQSATDSQTGGNERKAHSASGGSGEVSVL